GLVLQGTPNRLRRWYATPSRLHFGPRTGPLPGAEDGLQQPAQSLTGPVKPRLHGAGRAAEPRGGLVGVELLDVPPEEDRPVDGGRPVDAGAALGARLGANQLAFRG